MTGVVSDLKIQYHLQRAKESSLSSLFHHSFSDQTGNSLGRDTETVVNKSTEVKGEVTTTGPFVSDSGQRDFVWVLEHEAQVSRCKSNCCGITLPLIHLNNHIILLECNFFSAYVQILS